MTIRNLGDYFLIAALLAAFYFSFSILRPFFNVIFIAAILAVLFYPVYERVLTKLKNPTAASALVCALVLLIIIVPFISLLFALSQKSVSTYALLSHELHNGLIERSQLGVVFESLKTRVHYVFPTIDIANVNLQDYVLGFSDTLNSFIFSSTAGFLKGTSQALLDFALIIISLFYFFKEGPRWLSYLMKGLPLSERHNIVLFEKFSEVGVRSILVSLIIAVVQGVLGAIGFAVVGVPAFFLGILLSFLGLVPILSTFIVWIPATLILIAVGRPLAGILLFLYGMVVITTVDQILRAKLLKGKTQVHELFIFLSILGAIEVFGFWGIFYGPLILSFTLTLLHIYEMEMGKLGARAVGKA